MTAGPRSQKFYDRVFDKILEILMTSAGPLTSQEIAYRVGDITPHTCGQMLARLRAEGLVDRERDTKIARFVWRVCDEH